MILVTTEHVPGQQETASLGLVRGSSIRARHIGKDIMATFRNMAGGEVLEPATRESEDGLDGEKRGDQRRDIGEPKHRRHEDRAARLLIVFA